MDHGIYQTGHAYGYKPSLLSDRAAWCQWLPAFIHPPTGHICLWSTAPARRVEDALQTVVGKASSNFRRIVCWTSTKHPTWGSDNRLIGYLFYEQVTHSYSLTKTARNKWEFMRRSGLKVSMKGSQCPKQWCFMVP